MLGAQDSEEVNIQLLLVGVGVWWPGPLMASPSSLSLWEGAPRGWGPWERGRGHVRVKSQCVWDGACDRELGYFLPQNNSY